MIADVAGTVFSPACVTDFCKCAVTALGSRDQVAVSETGGSAKP